ncbi:hypothetical protein [Acinetobacter sp. ULE_I092]|uniref:hypothetical protein n=1 Tax=Acinetobacter sp. ULE_I092 TaxID=3373075 RepID=UPI003AF90859
MKIIVFRDESGRIVNIGEWDSLITEDENGALIINNPLPDGLTTQMEDIVINKDGSRSVLPP